MVVVRFLLAHLRVKMADEKTNGATILLVDDDQDALQLLTTLLQRSGYRTLEARDGASALRLADRHRAEIETVVLDLMMPGEFDGYAVCERLRQDSQLRRVPVVVLSAKGSSRDMALSYQAGAVQHITKPYDIPHLLAVIGSMVRLRRLEFEAASNADKYRTILEQSPLEMLVLTADRRIVEMNRAFARAFPAARVGDNAVTVTYDEAPRYPEGDPTLQVLETRTAHSGVVEGSVQGRPVCRRVHIAPLLSPDGEIVGLVDITEDVTAQRDLEENLRRQIERHNKALQQQDLMAEHLMNAQRQLRQKNKELEDAKALLQKLSVTDDLTGLFNRRYFRQTLQQEARRSGRYGHMLSLLVLDIDHFKLVNDTYGHDSGNIVLHHIGLILQHHLRETDTIVRYGGEEFVAILPETDRATALMIGERLRKAVEEYNFELPDRVIHITVSVGAASASGRIIDADGLFRHADEALYNAKRSGRNRVVADDRESSAIVETATPEQ